MSTKPNTIGKILILGDPHAGIRNKTVYNAAKMAFQDAIDTAKSLGIKFVAHTGDFADGPLDRPNLDTHIYQDYIGILAKAKADGIQFVKCPRGNHDIIKSFKEGYVTSWELLHGLYGYKFPLPILTLDFDPRGSEVLYSQVDRGLKKVQTRDHLLVLAHCHYYKSKLTNMRSVPLSDNYMAENLQKYIETKARDLGYKTVTFILGHDHTPKDYEDNVYVIGSPTPFTFNDFWHRRFLIFDFETGKIEQLKSTKGLKISTIHKEEHLDVDSVETNEAVEFESKPSKQVIQKLEAKGIKYRVLANEVIRDYSDLLKCSDFTGGYFKYETQENIRDNTLGYLEEVNDED